MNDRYLFKAKSIDNGEWVQGCYIYDAERGCSESLNKFAHRIQPLYALAYAEPVDPSTLCQCTGLKDKNGNLIWENDIVEILSKDGRFVIEWSDTEAKWQMHNFEEEYTVDFDNCWSYEVEVISNKFNNQEIRK